jgi:hypothetical protein
VIGLASAVDNAAATGDTNITVFLDGHGLSVGITAQPTVILDSSAVLAHGIAGAPADSVVRSADLSAIVQSHPDIKFNFIIDACYSGRFVDPLSLEPNVATITTSSNARQASASATFLTTQEVVNATSNMVTASGRPLYIAGNYNSDAVSPFTTGEVAALKQAFVGKGSDPDLTSVIKEARTLEPTYDLAAAAGETNPSPDPTPAATCPLPGTPDPTPTGGWFTGQ